MTRGMSVTVVWYWVVRTGKGREKEVVTVVVVVVVVTLMSTVTIHTTHNNQTPHDSPQIFHTSIILHIHLLIQNYHHSEHFSHH